MEAVVSLFGAVVIWEVYLLAEKQKQKDEL